MSPAAQASTGLSAEVFAIPLDGSRYIIYAPLRCAAFIANRKIVDLLAGLERGTITAAALPGSLLGLLRGLQIVGAPPESAPALALTGEPEPAGITLFLTTACNLRCTYCYASAGSIPAKFMSMETARRGVDFVAANAGRRGVPRLELGFHGGGEPTLNWAVLTGAYEYARRKAEALRLEVYGTLATNGVLDDRQIDWIAANLRDVSLSCDGLPSVHDRCRLTAAGNGSSHRVFHTMRRFDEAHFSYGIRLTVTAAHVSTLPDSVAYLLQEFRPRGIQVEPVHRLGRGAAERPAESDAFIAAYRAASERAHALGGVLNFSGARVGTLTNHFCGVSRDNFCLSPEGNVTACFEAFGEDGPVAEDFFYARPAEGGPGYTIDRDALARLRGLSVNNRPHCRRCFARWSCAGDCWYKWLAASGGGTFQGSPRCRIIRELTKDQIIGKILASGGLVWHDAAASAGSGARPC